MRLFVAAPLPASAHALVAAATAPLRDVPRVRWTAPERLHLTLRFLGERSPAAADRLADRVRAFACEPLAAGLHGLGGFPDSRAPRVLWVGVVDEHGAIARARDALQRVLLAAGEEVDADAFVPHVTVGRAADERAARALGRTLDAARADLPHARVVLLPPVLFVSERNERGSHYRELARATFT